MAFDREIHVLCRGGNGLNRAHSLEVDTPNRRSYLNKSLSELRRLRPDLIQVENRPGFLPEVRMACPHARILLSLHSDRSFWSLSRSHLRLHFRFADGFLVNSQYLKSAMESMFPECRGKVWIHRPGVDPNSLLPRKGVEKPGSNSGRAGFDE